MSTPTNPLGNSSANKSVKTSSESPLSAATLQRFEELLPFYINGTLPETDREFIEQCLQNPDGARSLTFYEHLRDTVLNLAQRVDTADMVDTADTADSSSRPGVDQPPRPTLSTQTDISQGAISFDSTESFESALSERIERLLARWRDARTAAETTTQSTAQVATEDTAEVAKRTGMQNAIQANRADDQATSQRKRASGLANWWPAIFGAGILCAALVLGSIGLESRFLLHQQDWDGFADIELVLAPGITPDHETVLAHLDTYQGKIVDHTFEDDRFRLRVDLKRRSANQHPLIDSLRAGGHMDDYVLLANR